MPGTSSNNVQNQFLCTHVGVGTQHHLNRTHKQNTLKNTLNNVHLGHSCKERRSAIAPPSETEPYTSAEKPHRLEARLRTSSPKQQKPASSSHGAAAMGLLHPECDSVLDKLVG